MYQLFKNTSGQSIELFAFDYTTGAPKTGNAANLTAYLAGDGGAVTPLGDITATEVSATNAPGWYRFDLTQAETNFDRILFTAKSATANVTLVGVQSSTRASTVVLAPTPISELTGDPGAAPTLNQAVMLLYMALRNRRSTIATEDIITNNAGTKILGAILSDDTVTFEKAKYV